MMTAQYDRTPTIEDINKFLSILEKEGYVRTVKK
jgi:hypothetical protein